MSGRPPHGLQAGAIIQVRGGRPDPLTLLVSHVGVCDDDGRVTVEGCEVVHHFLVAPTRQITAPAIAVTVLGQTLQRGQS
jgi:hypothetical protein